MADSGLNIEEILDSSQPVKADFRALGTTGLKAYGGFVNESTLRGLSGRQAIEVYKEMGDNDPSCGILLFMAQTIIRGTEWFVREASDKPEDHDAADFVRTLMNDMDHPWDDFISEVLSFIQYGFSVHEIVYKRRAGRADTPWLRSKYQDGRIGWRGLPLRSQDTIERWNFDDAGTLQGVVQLDPTAARTVEIPFEKLLLFRTSSYKNNPEGLSAFRRAYRPWYFKKHIEESEAIGIQRDLAGMPIIYMPPEVMAKKASVANRALYESFRDIVTKVRRDELEGVLMPLMYDDKGNQMFKFELLSSGGSRQFDTSRIIDRLKTEIFDTSCAGMIMLGQGQSSSGSWAMHSDKTAIYLMSLRSYLKQIKNVINLHLIPRVLELNGMEVTDYPQLDHSPVEQVDLKTFGETLSAMVQAGMPIFPNPDIERRCLEMLGLPVPVDLDRQNRTAENMPARTADAHADLEEIHPDTPAPTPEPQQDMPGTITRRAQSFGGMPQIETTARLR